MQFFQLFEYWNQSTSQKNIYSAFGQNLSNYLTDQSFLLKKSTYLNHQFINEVDNLSDPKNSHLLSSNDINKIIQEFLKDLSVKIKKTNDTHELKKIFELNWQFITFVILSFRFDINKISNNFKFNWFKIYKVNKYEDLKNQINISNQFWQKILTDDVKKMQDKMLQHLKSQSDAWNKFLQNEKSLLLRDTFQYQVKKDEQQTEPENKILDLIAKTSPDEIQKLKINTDKIDKAKDIKGFDEEFLKRFDQRGLPGSHKMMKPWFFKAFAEAEKNYGKILAVNSGYRTPEYQEYLGTKGYKTAKKNSPHVAGVAVDVSLIGITDVEKLINAFKEAGFNRFGVGKSFLHTDLGNELNPKIWRPYARWSYTY